MIEGMPCVLKISELCTSFHDLEAKLTHGTSGLLVEATAAGGSVYGENVIGIKDLQVRREGRKERGGGGERRGGEGRRN